MTKEVIVESFELDHTAVKSPLRPPNRRGNWTKRRCHLKLRYPLGSTK